MRISNIIKNNLFSLVITFIFTLSLITVKFLFVYSEYVVIENSRIISMILIFVFLAAFLLTLVIEFIKIKQSPRINHFPFFLLIFSLITSLCFSIFAWRVQSYSIGLYVLSVIIFFIANRRIYSFNKIYLLIILYALLNLIGTITTPQGFHFPEKTYSFYILPLSFCFFNFKKQTYLKIMKVFFRVILVYSAISIIFWQFNISYLGFSSFQWMVSKIDVDPYPGYHFAINWANFSYHNTFINYSHPSFVSLIINTALIVGFYLYYKKSNTSHINTIEIIIFCIFSLITLFAMQSRIGVISFLSIMIVSFLYYIKIKTPYFKAIIYIGVLFSIMFFFVFTKTRVSQATEDRPREISYAFATSYIKDHLWWGCGTGEQQTALQYQDEIMPNVNLLPKFTPYLYSHNQFLGDMVQFGIIGLIVLLTVLISLIYYSFKTRNYLLQMLMLLYILFMMIEEPFYTQEGIMRFMVFLTFFIAVKKSEKNRKSFSLNNTFSKKKIQG